jgi:hypothetical protein
MHFGDELETSPGIDLDTQKIVEDVDDELFLEE